SLTGLRRICENSSKGNREFLPLSRREARTSDSDPTYPSRIMRRRSSAGHPETPRQRDLGPCSGGTAARERREPGRPSFQEAGVAAEFELLGPRFPCGALLEFPRAVDPFPPIGLGRTHLG